MQSITIVQDLPTSPVPDIEIFHAPLEEPKQQEPPSPYATSFAMVDDRTSYRPLLLSPPPARLPLSPLRPLDAPKSPGLDGQQFQAMLKVQRERPMMVGGRKGPDLRKEVALKAHKSKQAERRALFLSKIGAPPSPSAVSMPKTPPDSPAVFHYSLPSPGLVSPLALFDSEDFQGERKVWVEQVDFRLPKRNGMVLPKEELVAAKTAPLPPLTPTKDFAGRGHRRTNSPPSLDQITAKYVPVGVTAAPASRRPIPLPAFLNSRRGAPPTPTPACPAPAARERSPSPSSTDSDEMEPLRLRFQAMTLQPATTRVASPKPLHAPPRSPCSPTPPELQIVTTRIPRTSSTSPTQLTEANLQALNSRARTAQDMLSAIRRRTVVCGPKSLGMQLARSVDGDAGEGVDDDESEKNRRRNSAPAELQLKKRTGFSHPVLDLPGGF